MKRIILIGAILLAGTTAVLVANNTCAGNCPVCNTDTCCPGDKCDDTGDCCKK